MAIRLQLPTGETLESLPLLDGADDWNEAVTLAVQLIPASISIWWMTRLAAAIQPRTSAILPLLNAAVPGENVHRNVRGVMMLAVRLTNALSGRLTEIRSPKRVTRQTVEKFNAAAAAFSLVGSMTASASPFAEILGIELSLMPTLSPVTNKTEMQIQIDKLNAFSSALQAIVDTLP